MKTTKKLTQLGLATLLVANAVPANAAGAPDQSSQAQATQATAAQQGPLATVVQTMPTLAQKLPGTYEHIKTNTKDFTDLFKQIDEKDAAYVKSTIAEIDNKMAEIYKVHLANVLKLQNKARTNALGVSVQEYLDLVTAIKTDMEATVNSIELMLQVPSARADGSQVAKIDNGRVQVQVNGAYRNVNFSQVLAEVKRKLEANKAEIYAIEIGIHHPRNGIVMQPFGGALHPDLMDAAFGPEEINKLRADAKKIEKDARILRNSRLEKLGLKNIRTSEGFVQTHGAKEDRRIETDEKGLQDAMDRLEEVFIVRSLARYSSGSQIGTFGTPDLRRTANVNRLPGIGSNEIVFDKTIYFEYDQIDQQRRAFLEVFKTQTDRSELHMMERLFDSNFSLLARASSFVNMLKGQRTRSLTNAFVLGLMLNDVEEELMISRPGGLAELKEHISQRVIEPARKRNAKMASGRTEVEYLQDLFSSIESASGDLSNAKSNSVDSADGGAMSIGGQLGDILNTYLTSKSKANMLQTRAAELEKGNKFKALSKSRMDDLFKKK